METKDLPPSARRALLKVCEAAQAVQLRPAAALGTAVALGFVIGLILRRFERPPKDE